MTTTSLPAPLEPSMPAGTFTLASGARAEARLLHTGYVCVDLYGDVDDTAQLVERVAVSYPHLDGMQFIETDPSSRADERVLLAPAAA